MVSLMIGTVAPVVVGEAGAREPFTWSTPLRHEPGLLGELRRSNRELLTSHAVALHAAQRRSFAAAALAISRCAQQIHAVQRLEALRLYPPISRCMANDPDTLTTVNGLRREANALARHFLRLTEGWYRTPRALPSAAATAETEALLKHYLVQKESRLYRFYALIATMDDATP